MGFRIRKSFKIAPGVRINLSKSGVSTSVGKAGATVNIGKSGVKSTVGLPGTGLSYSQNHSKSSQQSQPPKNGHVSGWITIAALLTVAFVISQIL